MFTANGKVSKCYDYGVKVSLVTINRSKFMVIGMTLSSNSYDGHALESTLEEGQPVLLCYPGYNLR